MKQHKDTTLDDLMNEVRSIVYTNAPDWDDEIEKLLIQWRDKAVVEALENLPTDIIVGDRIVYSVDIDERIDALKETHEE